VFEELWRHFGQPGSWRVFEDVAKAFEGLSSRGFRLGIASNFDSRLREVVAGRAELARCEAVFVSSDLGYSKPDPRFFAEVEGRLGVGSEEILLVGGDGVNDVEGARGARWRVVYLEREGRGSRCGAIRSLVEIGQAGSLPYG
jgi:putative hydrolase of the HAD superfamily